MEIISNQYFRRGKIKLYAGNEVCIYGLCEDNRLHRTIGTFALTDKSDVEIRRMIGNRSECEVTSADYPNVFVSPKCRTSRDILRNSGYKIKRSVDDADITIYPKINIKNSLRAHFVVIDGDVVTIFNVLTPSGILVDRLSEDNIDAIVEKLVGRYGNDVIIKYLENGELINLHFFTSCDEICDILLNKYPERHYALPETVQILPTHKISVETLETWRFCETDLLQKAICQSDWREYPFTLKLFLSNERRYDIRAANLTNDMQIVLDTIQYNDFLCGDNEFIVSPKDLEMANQWIMHRLGLPETGGFVDYKTYASFSYYANYLRKKIAVAPFRTNCDIICSELQDSI